MIMKIVLLVARIMSTIGILITSLMIAASAALSPGSWNSSSSNNISPLAFFIPFVFIATLWYIYKFRQSPYRLSLVLIGYMLFATASALHQSSLNAQYWESRLGLYRPSVWKEFSSYGSSFIFVAGVFALLIYLTYKVHGGARELRSK